MRTAQPDYAVPPGELIREWMDENGVTVTELAPRLACSPGHLSALLTGATALTSEVALTLEGVTGVPARRWEQVEALYQADTARLDRCGAVTDADV